MKKYDEVAEASNSEHDIFVAYNQSFKTKTSLNMSTSLAVQDFWPQYSLTGRGRNMTTSEESDIPSNSLLTTKIRLSQSLGPKIGVKASGGIRDYKKAVAMINAGANRIGAGGSVAIVSGSTAKGNY